MLRRNVRLRREYLYRKSLEGKERLLYEKKRKIKQALEGFFFCRFLFGRMNTVTCLIFIYRILICAQRGNQFQLSSEMRMLLFAKKSTLRTNELQVCILTFKIDVFFKFVHEISSR